MNKPKDTSEYYLSMDAAVIRPVFQDLRIQAEVISLTKEPTILPVDCFTLVKNTCKLCEKTMATALKEATELLGPYHKVPIYMETIDGRPFILIPLQSPRSTVNTWVTLHAIEYHKRSSKDPAYTDIHLTNGEVITVNASFTTFNRQYVLANALRTAYIKLQEQRQEDRLLVLSKLAAEPLSK
ncbi:competence protein ComK [Chryseomicrobium palamuruense]|uniref:Competence protein ComK n=1 Tax=Chryseomicrobium palamuruense TaxID=682973 RepID=A0ABV8UXK2_9BACL